MEEEWRTIEEARNYEVSNLGRVRNKNTGQVLKNRPTKNGYQQVCIKIDKIEKFQNRYVHRLVAFTWIPNNEKMKDQVNHIDNIKSHNYVTNLEWVTSSENQLHRYRNGSRGCSQRRVGKFTLDGILVMDFDSIVAAARFEGASRYSIDSALHGHLKTYHKHIWKYLD